MSCPVDDGAQVPEIADAPILLTSQRIELQGNAPASTPLLKLSWNVATLRSDDEAGRALHRRAASLGVDVDGVIAERQIVWKGQGQTHKPASANRAGLLYPEARPLHPLAPCLPGLGQQGPVDLQQRIVRSLARHIHRPSTGLLSLPKHM